MSNDFSKEEIKKLVKEQYTVRQMAEKLNVDEIELEHFYIERFKENRFDFPISVLLSKEWLSEKLQSKSVLDISEYVKASPSAIHNILKKYGIKNPKLKDIITPEVLFALYIEQKMSATEIAEKYHCSVESVKKLVANYNITASTRNTQQPKISQEMFHLLYFKLGFTAKQISEMLNCTPGYVKNELREKMISLGGPLSEDIVKKPRLSPYYGIISCLYSKIEPTVLYEQLQMHTISHVAELYDIIPETGFELFSKEWMEHVMQKMTLTEISDKFHISYSYVKSLKNKYHLDRLNVEDQLDADLIQRLCIENGWSDEEIARSLDISRYAIRKFRAKNGIKKKKRTPLKEKLSQNEFERLYLTEGLSIHQIAELYNVSVDKVSELRKKYGTSNPDILSHRPKGISEQKLKFLKKEIKYKGLK